MDYVDHPGHRYRHTKGDFTAYFRSVLYYEGANGTGFGLSQVYGFVKQADGTISVESNETGTAMTMRFPAVKKSYRKNAA